MPPLLFFKGMPVPGVLIHWERGRTWPGVQWMKRRVCRRRNRPWHGLYSGERGPRDGFRRSRLRTSSRDTDWNTIHIHHLLWEKEGKYIYPS